jgi:hypothetical protein
MPIKSLLKEMRVDVTKTEMICKAFDDAWAHLQGADDTLADPSKASIMRTALAKRIVETAYGEGMTSQKLRDDAIAHIKNNPLFPSGKRKTPELEAAALFANAA